MLTSRIDPQGLVHWDGLDAVGHGEVWRLVTPISSTSARSTCSAT